MQAIVSSPSHNFTLWLLLIVVCAVSVLCLSPNICVLAHAANGQGRLSTCCHQALCSATMCLTFVVTLTYKCCCPVC